MDVEPKQREKYDLTSLRRASSPFRPGTDRYCQTTGCPEESVLAAEPLAPERGSEKERNKSWLKGISL